MIRFLTLTLIAGAVALALVIGQRMSSDAVAVAIGVVFGVAASIPTSLLVVAATRDRRPAMPPATPTDLVPRHQQPQIFIVAGDRSGQPQQVPWSQPGQLPAPPASFYPAARPERQFRVVGEDDHWLEARPDDHW